MSYHTLSLLLLCTGVLQRCYRILRNKFPAAAGAGENAANAPTPADPVKNSQVLDNLDLGFNTNGMHTHILPRTISVYPLSSYPYCTIRLLHSIYYVYRLHVLGTGRMTATTQHTVRDSMGQIPVDELTMPAIGASPSTGVCYTCA